MTLAVQPVIQGTKWKAFDFFLSSYCSLVPVPPADLLALQINLTYSRLGTSQIVKIIKCAMTGPAVCRTPAGNILLLSCFFC